MGAYCVSLHGSSQVVRWAKGGFWNPQPHVSLADLCEAIAEVMMVLDGAIPNAQMKDINLWSFDYRHTPWIQLFKEASKTPAGIFTFYVEHEDSIKRVFLRDGVVATLDLGRGKLEFCVARTRMLQGRGNSEDPGWSSRYLDFIGVRTCRLEEWRDNLEANEHSEEIQRRLKQKYPWV